jgi:DNA mismatch endonuclease, patch repair protein
VNRDQKRVGRGSSRAVSRDRLTREHRSWNMSRIRSKDTTPEKVVRSMLHRMGYRFRLNVKIPIELGKQEGKKIIKYARPDIVLPKYKIA